MKEIPGEIEAIRKRLTERDFVRAPSGFRKKSQAEKLFDRVLGRFPIRARPEVPVTSEVLGSLLAKVDGIRNWLLENGEVAAEEEEGWLNYRSGAQDFHAVMDRERIDLTYDNNIRSGFKLFLGNSKDNSEIIIQFFYTDTFAIELSFEVEENRCLRAFYDLPEMPIKAMNKEECQIISYYCDLFTERFVKRVPGS